MPTVEHMPDYTHEGYYADLNDRILSSFLAQDDGMFCTNSLKPTTTVAGPFSCNVLCPGNSESECGVAWFINVYARPGFQMTTPKPTAYAAIAHQQLVIVGAGHGLST
ncbi:hypothetical protein AOQ84DRAFT_381158 [Glonium stellatum]|uniref:Uncharacterized protein n=1 Tax=Glonium stellatum TaxID=574774 RepID=A0A8E2ES92_9PEZI|nr:hypothetical protein AOQ84DRAFT_381158 [Glonium stellatum]